MPAAAVDAGHFDGNWIEPVKIVQEPPVQPFFLQGLLHGRDRDGHRFEYMGYLRRSHG